jgi:phosphatidylglycerol:prolipoprotein diacylglycerol transferase
MTINIDPVIGKLGPLEFRWYGVIMAVGVAAGLAVMSRELKRRGISPHHLMGLAILGVICGIIGARLVHVVDNFSYYLANPGKIFGGQLVGLAIYGVVGGGLIGLLIYCKWKKLPTLKVIDSTAMAFPVGQIIGRCANIINGDTWGSPTTSAWNLTYVNPNSFIPKDLLGVPTHPTPMYEQIWLVIVLGLLIWLMPRLMRVSGLPILAYAWLYSAGRFVLSFWRENNPVVWGLNEAQVIGLVVLVIAPVLGYWLVHRARRRGSEAPGGLKPGVVAATAGKAGSARGDVAKNKATAKKKAGASKTTATKKGDKSKAGGAKKTGGAKKAGGARKTPPRSR